MNNNVTSKEEILKVSRNLICQYDCSAVSIRKVAAACGVSVGAIYNYFPSKAELTAAAVESIWHEIFYIPEADLFQDAQAYISWIYHRLEEGSKLYPGFFTLHSLGFLQEEREEGRQRMEYTWNHIQQGLCRILKQDPGIRPDAFTDTLTAERFAEIIFSCILAAVLRHNYDAAAVQALLQSVMS